MHAVFEQMIRFVEDAGRLSLDLRAAGLNTTHKGSDLSQALTDADQAISALMHDRFGPRLIEEETAHTLTNEKARDLLFADQWTFIGDPIDGTKPFAGGLCGWGTMLAACRNGWPVASVMGLPAWVDERDRLEERIAPAEQRGLILAAFEGVAYWAATQHGKARSPLRLLRRPLAETHHVGWLPVAAKGFTLDYHQGLFPWCESGFISDAASLATGRLDATTFNHKLWDLAGTLPVLEALGYTLHGWPDLRPCPSRIIDLFDEDYTSGGDLWLICSSREQASRLAQAIGRAN